ncbi:DUF433 domain-containing protein [Cyanobacteria bacterium FACHB-DQ100]|uniref:DUF433 domain-containing protein n=1 Tax=Leptolyngbya sp. DQ-M1 TaxID=2933920 RepID=UPI0019C5951E|nr:DUF433 domain-containing protein [Cyanobacteria bacterium FACHB-DQ100]
MQLEDYFEFASPDEIRFKGHRIGLEDVLKYYLAGYSPEQILEELPSLNLEKVHAAIIYYLHDRSTIEAYLLRLANWREQRYQAWAESELSPVIQRLRALKRERKSSLTHS